MCTSGEMLTGSRISEQIRRYVTAMQEIAKSCELIYIAVEYYIAIDFLSFGEVECGTSHLVCAGSRVLDWV
jgi:hypothetical protein